MKFTNDLGSDNIKGLVWTLAVPSMLSQLVSVLYSIVDRMYIGNIPSNGTQALAGVGVCGPIVTLISSLRFSSASAARRLSASILAKRT